MLCLWKVVCDSEAPTSVTRLTGTLLRRTSGMQAARCTYPSRAATITMCPKASEILGLQPANVSQSTFSWTYCEKRGEQRCVWHGVDKAFWLQAIHSCKTQANAFILCQA